MDTVPPFDAGGAPHGFQGFRALKIACGYTEERPVTDSNIPVFRAQLRYQSVDEFIEGYSQFVLPDKMFIPLDEAQLKPVDSRVRFEFKLADDSRAMVGEGVVRQVRGPNQGTGPTGLVVEYTHLSRRSKQLVGQIVDWKRARARADEPDEPLTDPSSAENQHGTEPIERPKDTTPPRGDAGHQTESSPPPAPDKPSPAERTTEGPPPDIPDEPEIDDRDASAEPEEIETAEGEDLVDRPESPAVRDEQDPYDEFDDLDDISDAYGREPQQVGETEGGLQIMAYDDMSEEDAEEFAEFALGSDDEDVDQMFDDVLSGGAGGGDDLFGGGDDADMFDSGGGDDDMFGDAGDEADVFDDGGNGGDTFDDGPESPEELANAGNSDPGNISSAIDNELDRDAPKESSPESIEDESFSDVDPETSSDSSADHTSSPEAPAESAPDPNRERRSNSGLSDLSEEMADSGTSDFDFESEREATIEADTDPDQLKDGDIPSREPEQPSGLTSDSNSTSQFSGFGPDREDESDELDEALDSLEEESDDDRELSLSLGNTDDDENSEQPADSLEALVADEQKNLQENDNQHGGDKDALDEVLGEDTPPPPSDDFEFDISGKGPEFDDSERRESENSDGRANEQGDEPA